MHIREISARGFKRFTELKITDIPATAKLVVITGPNGSGKSSLFDALQLWHGRESHQGISMDSSYAHKAGHPEPDSWRQRIAVAFHEDLTPDAQAKRKLIYIRSAYRNEPDFTLSNLDRTGPIFDAPRISKLIDNDARVSDNYRRIVSATVEKLYGGQLDGVTVSELREKLIGPIRVSMSRVFEDLILTGPGNPLQNGSFFFAKGASRDFHYKNLSAGEKAAFDLILDLSVKMGEYDDTVFCIDEPETHMHTRLQGRLLEELFGLIGEKSQLWIATHSIGMLRKAKDLAARYPSKVVFIDFHDRDFDGPVVMSPIKVDRKFWGKMLAVTMDDLADLVAPQRIVLCEGSPKTGHSRANTEFDAKCYRKIFDAEFPDTDFVSVGNASDVESDKLFVGRAIQAVVSGTTIVRLVDLDDRSAQEVADLNSQGVRVLKRRHIEAYLMDDEILTKYCDTCGKHDKAEEVLLAKRAALDEIARQGKPLDDIKSAGGLIYTAMRRILQVSGIGNSVQAFLRDSLANHVTRDTGVYAQLRSDIFGTNTETI